MNDYDRQYIVGQCILDLDELRHVLLSRGALAQEDDRLLSCLITRLRVANRADGAHKQNPPDLSSDRPSK